MEFVNQSGVEAGWTLGFERDGRELLIVAIKATYNIPENGGEPTLAEEQSKLVKADEFTGEPGYSAPLRETDYSHRKLRCDVVLNGSAYAPNALPARSVDVSLQVGAMRKSFYVFGERRWHDHFLSASEPELFTQTPISYDCAYGGTDFNKDEPEKIATYVENPVGRGYRPVRRHSALVGELLPSTAESKSPISDRKGRYPPMSFGPVGRNFSPRFQHAGTYDQNWLDNEAPFWPSDFSYAYFQCAPNDQQVPFLEGGEEVELTNLTPDSIRYFRLPTRTMPVTFLPHSGQDIHMQAVCDTLLLEPDANRFCMTWRAPLPLRRHMFELRQTIVGDLSHSWISRRRAEAKGKTWYANLGELMASKQGKRRT